MKVKVSKIMAKTLNGYMPDGCKVEVVNLSPDCFRWFVDCDEWRNEQDYNIETGRFAVLKISYPRECYACDAYATTRILLDVFKHSDKTIDGFGREFAERFAI